MEGYEDCVLLLLNHGCNVNIQDKDGNTASWLAITRKHSKTFALLHHFARASNPHAGGELLCVAARRNDLPTIKELLKHGLNVDSTNLQGLTALQVSLTDESLADVSRFLILNGAGIGKVNLHGRAELEEMVKREVGYPATAFETPYEDGGGRVKRGGRGVIIPRVSVYRGHPMLWNPCSGAGKLISLPETMEQLKHAIGEKFGIYATNAAITDELGAEVDAIEVIRDGDRLFTVMDEDFNRMDGLKLGRRFPYPSSV